MPTVTTRYTCRHPLRLECRQGPACARVKKDKLAHDFPELAIYPMRIQSLLLSRDHYYIPSAHVSDNAANVSLNATRRPVAAEISKGVHITLERNASRAGGQLALVVY